LLDHDVDVVVVRDEDRRQADRRVGRALVCEVLVGRERVDLDGAAEHLEVRDQHAIARPQRMGIQIDLEALRFELRRQRLLVGRRGRAWELDRRLDRDRARAGPVVEKHDERPAWQRREVRDDAGQGAAVDRRRVEQRQRPDDREPRRFLGFAAGDPCEESAPRDDPRERPRIAVHVEHDVERAAEDARDQIDVRRGPDLERIDLVLAEVDDAFVGEVAPHQLVDRAGLHVELRGGGGDPQRARLVVEGRRSEHERADLLRGDTRAARGDDLPDGVDHGCHGARTHALVADLAGEREQLRVQRAPWLPGAEGGGGAQGRDPAAVAVVDQRRAAVDLGSRSRGRGARLRAAHDATSRLRRSAYSASLVSPTSSS